MDFLPAGDDLMRCVDLYNQTQSKWFEEMVTTCMVTSRISTAKSAVAMAAAAG